MALDSHLNNIFSKSFYFSSNYEEGRKMSFIVAKVFSNKLFDRF